MAAIGGAFLRISAIVFRILEFCCAGIILGIYSYFLAVLSHDNIHIPTWEKAVEGMSGAAVLYTIFGILFTLCLGGIAFFGFIAVLLDICFVGCFIAIAYYTRHGADSCNGVVNTPLGTAPSNADAPGAGSYHYVCELNTAVFAVSIAGALLFLITALMQVAMVRHHKKEKRYGPSPANNYTKGSGRRNFFRRKQAPMTADSEYAGANVRPSQETGTTLNPGYAPAQSEPKYGQPGYGQGHYYPPNNAAATNY